MARTWALQLASLLILGSFLADCSRAGSSKPEGPPSAATALSSISGPTEHAIVPTATPAPQEEVLAAYQRYWDAYGQALLDLDPTLVQAVAAGDRLQRIQEEIDELRRRGVAARTNVINNPVVVEFDTNSATIYDELINNSFYVDAVTKQPSQASGSGEIVRDTYQLQKIDGAWKVVGSSRVVAR